MKPKRIRSPRIVLGCAREFHKEVTNIAREHKFKSMSAMVMFAIQKLIAELKTAAAQGHSCD